MLWEIIISRLFKTEKKESYFTQNTTKKLYTVQAQYCQERKCHRYLLYPKDILAKKQLLVNYKEEEY